MSYENDTDLASIPFWYTSDIVPILNSPLKYFKKNRIPQ